VFAILDKVFYNRQPRQKRLAYLPPATLEQKSLTEPHSNQISGFYY
jgi:hypothetical protein